MTVTCHDLVRNMVEDHRQPLPLYALDGAWESDEEVEEFIRFTRAARQAENA